MRKCSIRGCKKERLYATGYCSAHQWRWKKYGDPSITTRNFQSRKKCAMRGCKGSAYCKDLCRKHYLRFKIHGDPEMLLIAPPGSGYRREGRYVQLTSRGMRKLEHILVAEKILGKKLPKNAVVHHVNENKLDNRPENLVICPDKAYHHLLHKRMRALKSCGHADWLKCQYCGQYDSKEWLTTISGGKRQEYVHIYHRACRSVYRRKRIAEGKSP